MTKSMFEDIASQPNSKKQPGAAQSFIDSYKKQATRVAGSSVRIVSFLEEITVKIVKKFLEFARQAVDIAVSKFLVELCAMIISAVSAAVLSKYKRPVDITTAGVFYNGGGQTAQPGGQPTPSSNQSMFSGSAFDNSWPGSQSSTRTGSTW